jgi:tetratricopeptide (TPR) repeat protein
MKNRIWNALVLLLVLSAGNLVMDAPASAASEKENLGSRSGQFTKYGDKWAVVIGIDRHHDPALNTVLQLDESAKRVSAALQAKGFAKDHVRLMLNGDATGQAILSTLSKPWLGTLSRKSDLVVLFFANQCFPSSDGKVYLLPYDTRLSNFYTSAISVEDILHIVKTNVQAKDVVMVFQTSFSGAPEMIAGLKTAFGRYNVSIHHNDLGENFTVLCSSKPGQPTWGTYFSDNFAEDLTIAGEEGSLTDLFNKIRNDTVYDTAKDCAGCKVQSPLLLSRNNASAISLGARAEDPVSTLPDEVSLYLKGQEIYSRGQELLDQYRTNRAKLEGWSDPSDPSDSSELMRKLEDSTSPVKISEEFMRSVESMIPTIREHLKENPSFGAGHYLLGRLLQFKGENENALAEYRAATKASPFVSSYHSWVARTQDRLGQNSADEWQEAYRLNDKNLSAIDNLANAAQESEHYDRAAELLNHAIALYPGDAGLRVRISDVLLKQGKLKQAISEAQEAVFLDEHSFDALVNLGNLLMANKDEHAARAAYREALDLGSREAEYYYVLGQALERTKDTEGAIQAWTRFVDGTSKDDKRVDEVQKRLDELKKVIQ